MSNRHIDRHFAMAIHEGKRTCTLIQDFLSNQSQASPLEPIFSRIVKIVKPKKRMSYLIPDELRRGIASRPLHGVLRGGRGHEFRIAEIAPSPILPGTGVPRRGGVLVRPLHLYHYPMLGILLRRCIRVRRRWYRSSRRCRLQSPLRWLAGEYRRVTVTRITDHHDIACTEYVHSFLVVVVGTGHVADSLGLAEITVGGMKAGGRGGGPVAGGAQG